MKSRINVQRDQQKLNFYLRSNDGEFYLFSQDYSKGVYEYFKNGRSVNEIRKFDKWNKNPRLNKTIYRLPKQIQYVEKYVMEQAA